MISWFLDGVLRRNTHHGPVSQADQEPIEQWKSSTLVLFLDFDGVMHRAENGSFENMPHLEWLLERMPDLRLVISSDWRLTMDMTAMQALFPSQVRARIVGTTPHLRGQPREQECLQFARKHTLTRYLAVDDDTTVFSSGCPWLVVTDRYVGLDRTMAEQIMHQFIDRFPVIQARVTREADSAQTVTSTCVS